MIADDKALKCLCNQPDIALRDMLHIDRIVCKLPGQHKFTVLPFTDAEQPPGHFFDSRRTLFTDQAKLLGVSSLNLARHLND